MRRFCLLLLAALFSVGANAQEHDRILIPTVANEPVAGAYGSQWVTEISLRYTGNQWMRRMRLFFPWGCPMILCVYRELDPGRTYSGAEFIGPNSPHGVVLRTDGGTAANTVISVRARDLSRALDTWGTEIPVVFINEQSTAPVVLLDIPTSDRFRVMLRMYDFGFEANEFIVDIRALNGDEILHQARIPSSILTSIGGSPEGIWFAALTLSDWPSGAPERVRVTISNVNEAKLWAFATVTNNETQHITVVSPSRVDR